MTMAGVCDVQPRLMA